MDLSKGIGDETNRLLKEIIKLLKASAKRDIARATQEAIVFNRSSTNRARYKQEGKLANKEKGE